MALFVATRPPNQALEPTPDRREDLLLMISTLKSEAKLALVSGGSAYSLRSHTKHILIYLSWLIAPSIIFADVTTLSADHRKIVEDEAHFSKISSTKDVPSEVLKLCGADKMADPGQRGEATDAITDEELPTKRLIWAARNGEFYVVHYERGGEGHSFHVLLANYKEDGGLKVVKLLWIAVAWNRLNDYAEFLKALKENKLDDTRYYYH